MPPDIPALFPHPREVLLHGGEAGLPASARRATLAALPRTVAEAERALTVEAGESGRVRKDLAVPAEGYRLTLGADGLRLAAADARGLLHGARAARTLLAGDRPLPCLEIRDHPDLAVRGFMLDVSRGKVPTLPELLALVEAMGELRLNQLQLYVEHSFAFPGHEAVWKDASPLTPEDLAAVGARAAELGIELVPNLNTFGHLERWLRHEPYRRLAECPEGWTHPLTGQFKPHPSTLFPSDASLAFVEGLLDAYLPHFASGQVNIGGDEPWELGQGRSKDAVAARGKHRVYLDFLNRIHGLVRARGKRMQFWGDILLEDLELAGEAPREALPVVWGYDPGHPFDAQCGRLAELGRDYLVAPGAGTWQSLTGRLPLARQNVREAVDAARRHRASGILMTTWGDNGYHQPWPTFWIPLGEAAARAWCATTNAEPAASEAVAPFLGDRADAPAVAAALERLGRLDAQVRHAVRNKSLSWDCLTADDAALAALARAVAPEEAAAALRWLDDARPRLAAIRDTGVRDELEVGADLARAGLSRLLGRPATPAERAELVSRHRRAWLRRARPGGLEESVTGLNLG